MTRDSLVFMASSIVATLLLTTTASVFAHHSAKGTSVPPSLLGATRQQFDSPEAEQALFVRMYYKIDGSNGSLIQDHLSKSE